MIGPALPAIELGGVIIPLWAASEMQQQYAVIGPRPIMRMMDGIGKVQAHWQRIKSTVSGSGWMPSGLDGLSMTSVHVLKCAGVQSIEIASNAIMLPANRRTDYVPGMTAMMPGRVLVETPSVLSGNTLTGTTVPGAIAYIAWYWPQLTGYITSRSSGDHQGEARSWQFEFEEN